MPDGGVGFAVSGKEHCAKYWQPFYLLYSNEILLRVLNGRDQRESRKS